MLAALNPNIEIEALAIRLEGQRLLAEVKKSDLVLDCSDNFTTRFDVNRACFDTTTPLVSGAAIRFEGQIAVFDPRQTNSPCYQCLYPDQGELAESCTESGVVAPITGIVGSIQALEAIKLLLAIGQPLTGKLLILDGLNMKWHSVRLPRNPGCPVCG